METEKAAYLDGMAELFKAKTLGYGIWTYRDYGDNKVYNSQFALAQQGWKFSGGSKVEEHNGSRMQYFRFPDGSARISTTALQEWKKITCM